MVSGSANDSSIFHCLSQIPRVIRSYFDVNLHWSMQNNDHPQSMLNAVHHDPLGPSQTGSCQDDLTPLTFQLIRETVFPFYPIQL